LVRFSLEKKVRASELLNCQRWLYSLDFIETGGFDQAVLFGLEIQDWYGHRGEFCAYVARKNGVEAVH
jgi:hypothetical protein